MTNRAKVTILLVDPENAYHWVEVRGHIAEITENGAREHIDQLARKYTGKNYVYQESDQVRVIYKIEPDKVNAR